MRPRWPRPGSIAVLGAVLALVLIGAGCSDSTSARPAGPTSTPAASTVVTAAATSTFCTLAATVSGSEYPLNLLGTAAAAPSIVRAAYDRAVDDHHRLVTLAPPDIHDDAAIVAEQLDLFHAALMANGYDVVKAEQSVADQLADAKYDDAATRYADYLRVTCGITS